MHPDELGPAHVERLAGHDIDRVTAADTDGNHPQPARVGRVAVGPDHHPARKRVVLEHDLMDDPRSGLPETDAESGAGGLEEVVHLGVAVQGRPEIDGGGPLGLDQMIAVDGRRHRDLVQAGDQELEGDDLGQRVLKGDPVGIEVGVAAPARRTPDWRGSRR